MLIVLILTVSLSGCMIKDIKNEEEYSALNDVVCVYNNCAYYNDVSGIKVLKYESNKIIQKSYIDDAVGIFFEGKHLYYKKDNKIICQNIKSESIEKEYVDEKILDALYKNEQIFYTTGEALKRINLKSGTVEFVSYDPCVINEEYITFIKQEKVYQNIPDPFFGGVIPYETTQEYLVKATYGDYVNEEISTQKIMQHIIAEDDLYYLFENALYKVDVEDEHNKKVFEPSPLERMRSIISVENGCLYFDTMEIATSRYQKLNIYKFELDLNSGNIKLVDTEEVEWFGM